jgi:hypothetical protein
MPLPGKSPTGHSLSLRALFHEGLTQLPISGPFSEVSRCGTLGLRVTNKCLLNSAGAPNTRRTSFGSASRSMPGPHGPGPFSLLPRIPQSPGKP